MISEYKLYHGAFLAELVDQCDGPVTIDELKEDGRLSSYVLDSVVGLLIKYSTNRLHPWQFGVTRSNLLELLELKKRYPNVYVVLICHTDGIVVLTLEEILEVVCLGGSDQMWVRVDRRKKEQYSVKGASGMLRGKRPHGVHTIVQALRGSR